jgi:hypothetical protein
VQTRQPSSARLHKIEDEGRYMTEPSRPTLRVISGSPTPEELAVVAALVVVAGNGGDDDEPAPTIRRGGWSDPARLLQAPVRPGPRAWRSSLR